MWTSLSSKDNMIYEMFKVALQLEDPWKLCTLNSMTKKTHGIDYRLRTRISVCLSGLWFGK
jgi:hypothetical protein